MVRSVSLRAALCLLPLLLAACNSGKKDDLAALDAQLTNNATDPALKGALEDQIVVDPKLTNQANANAIRPADRPATGGVPRLKPADATAQALKLVGGKLLHAPAAVAAKPCDHCDAQRPVTLGALAREQRQRQKGGGTCTGPLDYGMQWAGRLPASFPLYPGAQLTEAAGADTPACALRAVSFVTGAPMTAVIDFYYTQAKRAGYDAEHQMIAGQHVLGGTQATGAGAYFLSFTPAAGGGTQVDMIANQGQ